MIFIKLGHTFSNDYVFTSSLAGTRTKILNIDFFAYVVTVAVEVVHSEAIRNHGSELFMNAPNLCLVVMTQNFDSDEIRNQLLDRCELASKMYHVISGSYTMGPSSDPAAVLLIRICGPEFDSS